MPYSRKFKKTSVPQKVSISGTDSKYFFKANGTLKLHNMDHFCSVPVIHCLQVQIHHVPVWLLSSLAKVPKLKWIPKYATGAKAERSQALGLQEPTACATVTLLFPVTCIMMAHRSMKQVCNVKHVSLQSPTWQRCLLWPSILKAQIAFQIVCPSN